jgi:hypothetical protein
MAVVFVFGIPNKWLAFVRKLRAARLRLGAVHADVCSENRKRKIVARAAMMLKTQQ